MSKIALSPDPNGAGIFTIASPNSGTNRTLTLPDNTGTILTTATGGIPINGPAFGAYLSTAQNITTSTFTKIQFNTEEFDTANCYDNATNYRFTPNVAGYYQLSVGMYFNCSSSCTRALISIYKNGSSFKYGNYMPPVTSDSVRGIAVGSSLVYANGSTDYFEVYGFITATSPYFDGSQNQVYFNGFLARAA